MHSRSKPSLGLVEGTIRARASSSSAASPISKWARQPPPREAPRLRPVNPDSAWDRVPTSSSSASNQWSTPSTPSAREKPTSYTANQWATPASSSTSGKWATPPPASSAGKWPTPPPSSRSPAGKWGSPSSCSPAGILTTSSPSSAVERWATRPPSGGKRWGLDEGKKWGLDERKRSDFTKSLVHRHPSQHHRDSRHPSASRLPRTHSLAAQDSHRTTDGEFERDRAPHMGRAPVESTKNSAGAREQASPPYLRKAEALDEEIDAPRDAGEGEVGFDLDGGESGARASGTSYESGTRNRKRDNLAFKQRGSVLRGDGSISDEQWTQKSGDDMATKKKRRMPGTLRKLKVDLHIPSIVTVEQLSRLLKVPIERLQDKMVAAGMEETSPDHILTQDYSALLAEEFDRNAIIDDEAAFDIHPPPPAADRSSLPARPPIVTIMGHVDHGKTTLLDTLRSASVAAGEAGGITQHIGAFSVPVPNNAGSGGPPVITFLDTPGHAAFSAMRARGARVTDLVVLVVAADDGVKPQTKEVIELVKKDDKVQLVVAINKIDKSSIDLDRVYNALLVEEVHVEPLGGETPTVHVSGLTGKGLSDLVETISLVSEMQDLRAERDGPVQGYVLESKFVKGFGAVATVLILRGCLKPGTNVIAGLSACRVRAMADSAGKTVKAAYPGDAITVSGWKELPAAGDEVLQGSEPDIKKALANRARKADLEQMLEDVDVINEQRKKERELRAAEALAEDQGEEAPEPPKENEESQTKTLPLLIKGDVSGSVEALMETLKYIGNDVARTRVIGGEVGEVTTSDVMRAKVGGGIIVAFCVPVPKPVQAVAKQSGVEIYSSAIIYQVIDEIRHRVTDLLPQEYEKKVTGEAKVQELFEIHKGRRIEKVVGGCRVTNGVIERNKTVQVVRDAKVIFEGQMETFKHRRDDITTAKKDSECGIRVEGFDDLKAGDLIQSFELRPLPKFI